MSDIILINGSLNLESNTKKILTLMNKILLSQGYSSKVINVGDLNLPFYSPNTNSCKLTPDLWNELYYAKGYIIGSPEYHGGYTGVLKNFIDYFDIELFKNKPVGLVVLTGGIKSGNNTLNSLRMVFRNLHCNVIPQQIAISEKEFINNNLPTPYKNRIISIIRELLNYINILQINH